jgi:hypothetical protein
MALTFALAGNKEEVFTIEPPLRGVDDQGPPLLIEDYWDVES